MVNHDSEPKYIIDTSSILSQKDDEPHRRSINKTLWHHMDELIEQKRIGLHGVVLPIDDDIQDNVKKVVTSNPQLIDFKQVKSSGDAFLIATAMKYGLTVITEESKKGEKKIPYVCKSLNVPCIDILGLCEREGWQF